jgi:hypothetical protein
MVLIAKKASSRKYNTIVFLTILRYRRIERVTRQLCTSALYIQVPEVLQLKASVHCPKESTHQEQSEKGDQKMQRTSKVPKKPPRRPQDELRGSELAEHKLKIRNQKEEIDKLKRSINAQRNHAARLEGMVKYLTRTAESEE